MATDPCVQITITDGGADKPAATGHDWPSDSAAHVWGPWYVYRGMPKPTQYRSCVHPLCKAVEHREAPIA